MKECKRCKCSKSYDMFNKRSDQKDGLDYYCKTCVSEINKINREKNRDVLAQKKKEHYEKNREHYAKYKSDWKRRNRERINENERKYRIENPISAFVCSFRGRLRKVLHYKKDGRPRSIDFIGCSTDMLRSHIESMFKDGMNWNNYGEWHIDHIIPLDCANDMDEVYTLCHYSNLQPLWWYDNLKKSSKMPDDLIELGWTDLETGEFTPSTGAEVIE